MKTTALAVLLLGFPALGQTLAAQTESVHFTTIAGDPYRDPANSFPGAIARDGEGFFYAVNVLDSAIRKFSAGGSVGHDPSLLPRRPRPACAREVRSLR